MKSLFAGAVEAQRNWHRCWTRAAGARSQPCFWTSVRVNHCMKEGLLRTSNKLAINSHGVTLHLSQVSYALMMFIWKSQVSHYWVVLTAVKLSWWYQITRYSCLETGFMASCYPVLPSSYIWAENGKESLQACLKSYNLIFYLLKWANDLSNLDRHRTRRDGLQQLLSNPSKILARIKNTRRKCKSSALMDGGGYPEGFGNCFQCRYTQQSFYCCFFVDLQNEEDRGSNTHFTFLQTKSFCRDKGWADKSVNLAVGDMRVYWVNPALCSSCVLFYDSLVLNSFPFQRMVRYLFSASFTNTRILQLNSLK